MMRKDYFRLQNDLMNLVLCIIHSRLPHELTHQVKNVVRTVEHFPFPSLTFSSSRDELGFDPTLAWCVRPFLQFLYANYFRVELEGEKYIPFKSPSIIVANHAGGLPYDAAMINQAIYNIHPQKDSVRFVAHNFAVDLPILGSCIKRLGAVRATPENVSHLLKNGHTILIFPEGIKGLGKLYDQKYKLKSFRRGGFVRMAIQHRVPIIPTTVIGSEEIHPIIWNSREIAKRVGLPYFSLTPTWPWLGLLGAIPLPTKWRIIFGKPISFRKFKKADLENENLIKEQANVVRKVMQKMINEALAKRTSIWF